MRKKLGKKEEKASGCRRLSPSFIRVSMCCFFFSLKAFSRALNCRVNAVFLFFFKLRRPAPVRAALQLAPLNRSTADDTFFFGRVTSAKSADNETLGRRPCGKTDGRRRNKCDRRRTSPGPPTGQSGCTRRQGESIEKRKKEARNEAHLSSSTAAIDGRKPS